MPATLRPTRLEVSDRFPMLGFSIRNEAAAGRSELALASDPALFDASNKAQRNQSNFYCNRATGGLQLARGENMYIVPPEVLARFVGQEKLFFGLASSTDSTPLRVDVRPGKDSPYISLRGLSARSMTRVRVLPNRQQRAAGYNGAGPAALEWAGDAATPGMVSTAPTNGAAPAVNGAQPYDDGFGPLPPATPAAQGMSAYGRNGARTRGMGGGADVATAIGGFVVESVRDSQGDVTWELDQFAHIKHPNDSAPANAQPFRDAPVVRLDSWPVAGGLVDDISAWFSIEWQFNGRSLGNVRISNIGTNDAVGWGLSVRAEIMDDNILYQPGNCAALRVRLHYRFTRSIGSDVLAVADVHLFGNGTMQQSHQFLQASTFAAEEQARMPAPPPPRARAMDGDVGAAIAIGGFILSSIRDSQGDVTWDLDQFAHIKHPNDTAPSPAVPFQDAPTIRLNSWPVSGGVLDDISAWFSIDWQFNGRSLGNIRISNIGTNDSVGWGLSVRAQIMDDNILYNPGQCAALRVRLHYRFTRSIGSDVLASTDIHLYGNGTFEQSSQWLQSSTFGLSAPEPVQMPAPPPPRARAMDGGVGAAIAIGGFILSSIRDSQGDVTWDLDQFAHIKHPNDTAPSPAVPFRDAPTIRLNSWPVSGGVLDDISAWFSIDWQFNGRSLGNIRISNIGTNDSVGWGLSVRAQIMDDNILYNPGQCAALRVRLHYRFTRSLGSDVLASTDIHLYGNGTFEQSSQWLQSSTFSLAAPEPVQMPAPPPPRARAMDGGVGAAIAIGGFILSSIRDSQGDVTWDLDQFAHIKHPNDTAPSPAVPFQDAPTIRLNSWPVSGGVLDDISAWFSIDWQFNGRSLGNIRISNIGTNDSVGWGLSVRAQIMDDNILYNPGQCAALRVRLHYRFTRSLGSDVLASTDIHLYGNGTFEQSSQWLQSSTFGLSSPEPVQMPAPPPPRARAMDGGVGAAIAIGGFILSSIRDSQGDVTWELDQFAHIKHPNDTAPSPAVAFRDAPTIRLNSWPVSGGVLDDISAWFSIDWQFNGRSLGNIRISNIGTNDSVGWGLSVRAQIMDDNILYQPGNCAALRVRLHYRFTRSLGSDVLASTDIHLYGNGTFEQSSQWLQSSTFALANGAEQIKMPAPPPVRARAMDSVGVAIGGFVAESVRDNVGDVTWELDQFAHIKYPNDTPPSPAVAFRDANTIRLNRWPVSGGVIDDISAWFSIDWQFDGRSLGNIRISNIGTNDAVGWSLHVRAQVMDDNVLYNPGQCAALRIRFHYRFSRSIGSDVIGVTDVHLYGNGTHEESSQWLQSSALGMDADTGTNVTGSSAGVTWNLAQYPGMKNSASQVAASGRIPGEAIRLSDWPYLDEANGGRTNCALDVAWEYDASGAVGGIRITPGRSASAGGRSLAVSATIQELEGTPSTAALQATIRYAFTHASEGEQVAVTTIKFYGNGKFVRDSEWQADNALVTA
jgi:hypothetical protein